MSTITSSPQPTPRNYPDADAHRRRWRRLAREIAERSSHVTDDKELLSAPERPGSLEIIGSGIEASGFTRSDEARIQAADHVFYCVADPATKIWILTQRPDAYDLYVLYDDSKPRYLTYMQMTEAMLHYVRQGAYVVAIFYGHPGIFVLSTHRAVTIARREGHQATMRAAVSALDTLCADLGVDPSQPGMQMYEATDMLIRHRRPDPGLHLVLWQVGLIGELGYRRQGYLNSNFGVLLDYLEDIYGPEHTVINYVGSRYSGIEALIDRQTLANLRDPLAQSWVTGISTFYLPPKSAGQSDPAMLERLGLIRPGQPVRAVTEPLRVIDRYGKRERRAFADFAHFDVPASYQWQPDTAAGRFVLALADDADLRRRYREEPQATLLAWGGGLNDRERQLLAQREPGAVQLAAKGDSVAHDPGKRIALEQLLTYQSKTAALSRAIGCATPGTLHGAAADWSRKVGLTVDWPGMSTELTSLLRTDLAPWSGFYVDSGHRLSLSVFSRVKSTGLRLDINGQRLVGARYQAGVLTWKAEAGNPCSGYLQSDLSARGQRSWVGLVWPAGEAVSNGHKVALHAQSLGRPACQAAGDYRLADSTIRIVPNPTCPQGVAVLLNDKPLDAVAVFNGRETVVGEFLLPLSARHWETPPAWLDGDYRLRLVHGRLAEMLSLRITHGRVEIEGTWVTPNIDQGRVAWIDGPAKLVSGELEVVLDPITLRPLLHGTGRSASGSILRLRGMALVKKTELGQLLSSPRFGLPAWAWKHLVEVMEEASQRGGLFLWHAYDRTRTNLRALRHVLERLRQDEVEEGA